MSERKIPSQETEHLFVNRRGVWVDEGIADLLEAIWDYGLRTKYSCEGGTEFRHTLNDGSTVITHTTESYIMFCTIEDAIKCMRVLRQNVPECDFNFSMACFEMSMAPRGIGGGAVRFHKGVLPRVTELWQKTVANERA